MDSEFDIFLNNSQKFHLGEEENNYFHVELPTPIYFKPNKYGVGLVNFSYDKNKMVNCPANEFKIIRQDPKKNQRKRINNYHFSSIGELLSHLKLYGVDFVFFNGKLRANFAPDIVKLEFYGEILQRILGFGQSVISSGESGLVPPNINAMVDAVYIKCDFCELRVVGSLFLPVLTELPSYYKRKLGDGVLYEKFNILSFVEVTAQELHSVKLTLINQNGELVKFLPGAPFSCSLRFKKY